MKVGIIKAALVMRAEGLSWKDAAKELKVPSDP
jgi:hypothetical protein